MDERLRHIIIACFLSCLLIFFIPPVKADDTSVPDHTILLTINWLDDTPQDRPEGIIVELYRSVDGEEVPMDSRTLTSADQIGENTWQASFEYLYGNVWEYAFKILGTNPETGLYAYQLLESGNGTNHYTFDFVYGHGSTEMTVVTQWDDDSDRLGLRPDSVTIELVPLNGNQVAERSIIVSGDKTENTWTAKVTGLNDAPSNYYLIVKDLPESYSNIVTRGDSSNMYINTNTLNSTAGSASTGEQGGGNAAADLLLPETAQKERPWMGTFLNCLLLLAVVAVSLAAILKHRELVKRGKKRK